MLPITCGQGKCKEALHSCFVLMGSHACLHLSSINLLLEFTRLRYSSSKLLKVDRMNTSMSSIAYLGQTFHRVTIVNMHISPFPPCITILSHKHLVIHTTNTLHLCLNETLVRGERGRSGMPLSSKGPTIHCPTYSHHCYESLPRLKIIESWFLSLKLSITHKLTCKYNDMCHWCSIILSMYFSLMGTEVVYVDPIFYLLLCNEQIWEDCVLGEWSSYKSSYFWSNLLKIDEWNKKNVEKGGGVTLEWK
jgi:hypothetical protein